MKNKYHIKLTFFKIIIFSRFFFYTLFLECNKDSPILKNNECVSTYCTEEQFITGECIINEPITKQKWINNIIIVENTNGDIYLSIQTNSRKFIFGTTLSNKKDRIYYGFGRVYPENRIDYIFNYDNHPYLIINRNDSNILINPEISFIKSSSNNEYIISIGTNNSIIELLSLEDYINGHVLYSPNVFFLNETKIIKGVSSINYNKNYFIYIAITSPEEEPNDYYLSFFFYQIDSNDNFQLKIQNSLNVIKNEYVSCFIFNDNSLSCIYLSKDNNYVISMIRNIISDDDNFEIKHSIIIGSPSNPEENKYYFLKGIIFQYNTGLYCYYSGDSDEIPTFLIKKKPSVDNWILEDAFSELNIIYLYDYSFNNDIKYNDIVKRTDEEFFFISTNNNIEFLIIALLKIKKQSSQYKLLIRYYTIKLQEFYNIKILNGFKAIFFNSVYLSLALDFCNFDICQNSNNIINNAGLIIFSYLNRTSDVYIDFIEYAFNNNKKDLIVNFTENFKIDNNIFGIQFNSVIMNYVTKDDNIKYYDIANECYRFFVNEEDYEYLDEDDYPGVDEGYCESDDLESNNILIVDESLIKIELTDYSSKEITIQYSIQASTPNDLSEFNKFCDKYNDTFGNIDDRNLRSTTNTQELSYYYVSITQDLTTECNDINCTLCLENNKDYCIICKDDNYTIIHGEGYEYGKIKKCIKIEYENESTEKTNFENEPTNQKNVDESTNISENENENDSSTIIKNTDGLTEEKDNIFSTTDKFDNTDNSTSENDNLSSIVSKTENINDNKTSNNYYINTDEFNVEKYQSTNIENMNQDDLTEDQYQSSKSDNLMSTNIFTEEQYQSSKSNDSMNTDKLTEEQYQSSKSDDLMSTNILTEEQYQSSKSDDLMSTNILTEEHYQSSKNTDLMNNDKLTEEQYQTSKSDDLMSNNILTEEEQYHSSKSNGLLSTDRLSSENGDDPTDISSYNDFSDNKINTDYLTNSNTIIEKTINSELSDNNSAANIKLSLEDLFDGKYKNTNLSGEEIKYLYEELKQYLYNNYNGKDTIIINTGNVNIEISNIDSQSNSKDLSTVDLGDCEQILKDKYCKEDNSSLTILKIDIKPENETSKYVQYEIYEPLAKLFLELNECAGINAIINVPVEFNSDIETLYDSLASSGYNIFDEKDSFYNDICAVYTTENNTDILLYDRRMDIYKLTVNLSVCQDGCTLLSYNSETNKAKCDCPINDKKMITDLSQLEFDKNEMVDEFYETLQHSNFKVLVCYELVLNLKLFVKNIGSILMAVLFFLFLILMMVHISVSSKKLNAYIQSIIKQKYTKDKDKKINKNKITKKKKTESINGDIGNTRAKKRKTSKRRISCFSIINALKKKRFKKN